MACTSGEEKHYGPAKLSPTMNAESHLRAGVESDRSSCPLTLRLFGPFEVGVGGAPLPRLRARKGQWLLALLTLHAHRDVERAWLAGTLWPDSLEPQAFNNLRVNLTDLRRALGPEAGRLHSPTIHSLRLDLSGAEADLLVFDRAIASGGIRALEQAVALYRGPLLEGCAEPWAFQERQAREQAYLGALETLARHAEETGDPAAAERYLRRAVAADPLRESTQRTLMQALAAGGNYAAALVAYRELRLLLHREVNAEPDPETRRLFEQIRTEARRRAETFVALRSSFLRTEKRRVRSSAPLASGTTRHNLPCQLTSFIGREPQLAEIPRLLRGHRLVTLTGAGGCGKTRLALEVAAGMVKDFADGVWHVELAALADGSLVPQTVASALGVREEPGRPLAQTLVEYLRGKSALLVLDNCEHLLAASAQLAEMLLRACPNLQILATSREGLGIAGEANYRVPSLSLPDLKRLPPAEELNRYEAVCLFIDRAIAALSSFKLTDQNARAVAQVCSRLDGIPLALELAGARVRVLSVEQIAARLDDRFRLLTGGSRTALPRQQTLQALIDWSYDLLSEPERRLLRRLSVFTGGWTLVAAEGVCAGDGIEEWEVLDQLTELVDKSLVAVEEQGPEVRYRLLETVRQYGRDRLVETGEAGTVRGRHRDWFLALAEEAAAKLHGADKGVWLDRLDQELDNLRLALDCSIEQGESKLELRLAAALSELWNSRCHWEEGRQWVEGALARTASDTCEPDGGLTRARALALRGAGSLAANLGDYVAARSRLEESAALFRELGEKHQLATVLRGLHCAAEDLSTVEEALKESAAIYQEVGDQGGLAISLRFLGNLALQRGEYAQARALYEESVRIARELGDKGVLAIPIAGLGELAWRQGDYAAARTFLEETVALRRETRDVYLAGFIRDLGTVLCEQGDYGEAAVLFEESLAISRERGQKSIIAGSLAGLGVVARHQGDYEAARSLGEQSLAISKQSADRRGIARALALLGLVAQAQGDSAKARSCHAESLALWRELGEDRYIAECLEGLAEVARAEGCPERAARLVGAARALRDAVGYPHAPANQLDDDRNIATIRAALGEEAFAAAWAAGRAMSLEDAIAQALDETAEG
jgi:predicted ATPase/DNA-binding SARP family transcriptional activator